jgi:hypothetical protein
LHLFYGWNKRLRGASPNFFRKGGNALAYLSIDAWDFYLLLKDNN